MRAKSCLLFVEVEEGLDVAEAEEDEVGEALSEPVVVGVAPLSNTIPLLVAVPAAAEEVVVAEPSWRFSAIVPLARLTLLLPPSPSAKLMSAFSPAQLKPA